MQIPEFNSFTKQTEPDEWYKTIRKRWLDLHVEDTSSKIKELLSNASHLESMAQGDSSFFMIFNTLKFEVIYLGSNFEACCGYTEEEVTENRIKFFFKKLHYSQLGFFIKLYNLIHYIKNKIPSDAKKEFSTFTACGLNFQHKSGQWRKILMRVYPLELLENGAISLQLVHVQDVTNLTKSNDYWMYSAFGNNPRYMISYLSAGLGRQTLGAMFTEREMEVLRMVAEGQQTSEIAKQLFLSPFTVEKHRKNMISRLGARDTVALAELCKKAGIL